MEENKLSIEKDFWWKELTALEITRHTELKHTVSLEIEKITFGFGDKSIVITPVLDTAEVEVKLVRKPATNTLTASSPLTKYIGKQLNFIWECTNLQGCFDMYALSFALLDPDLLILCNGVGKLLLFETNLIDPVAEVSSYEEQENTPEIGLCSPGYWEKPLGEIANLAAGGDKEAGKVLKLIKKAGKYTQKYGGK